MKFIATVLVTLGLALGTAPADASRPMVHHHYRDVCFNVKGKQPIYEVYGSGPYRFNLRTPYRHDCVRRNP